MNRWRAICPAKINLGLRVVGRRSDGYHEIVTIFQAIDLCDVLEGQAAETLTLEISDPSIPAGESNLVVRAARLLQERCAPARGLGARLTLDKGIPAGAGLGGGSSDAAGALMLLNALWALNLDSSAVLALAAELGSDVPFFLTGGTALGTGRGTTIEPLPPIAARKVLLGSPPFGLSTPDVYRALEAPLTVERADVTVPRLFVKFAKGNDFALARNDLEAVAFRLRGELAIFRDALSRSGAEVALVSGSGSTVFGLFRAGTDVSLKAEILREEFPGWTVRVCTTIVSGVRIVPAVE
jgi:4-diphosphocytidyl-2-C-methyl-D-erythritol kinase